MMPERLPSSGLFHILEHFLTFPDSLVDSSDVEEGLLGKMVEFAAENHLEHLEGCHEGIGKQDLPGQQPEDLFQEPYLLFCAPPE